MLGTARIAPAAVVKPARVVDGVEITAVAARDRGRAEAFAAKHGVPTVHDSYAALVADSTLDAVYLPAAERPARAGKHVWREKPFTANAAEAREVATAAARTDLVAMEG